jgi:hypothetical protein
MDPCKDTVWHGVAFWSHRYLSFKTSDSNIITLYAPKPHTLSSIPTQSMARFVDGSHIKHSSGRSTATLSKDCPSSPSTLVHLSITFLLHVLFLVLGMDLELYLSMVSAFTCCGYQDQSKRSTYLPLFVLVSNLPNLYLRQDFFTNNYNTVYLHIMTKRQGSPLSGKPCKLTPIFSNTFVNEDLGLPSPRTQEPSHDGTVVWKPKPIQRHRLT